MENSHISLLDFGPSAFCAGAAYLGQIEMGSRRSSRHAVDGLA